MILEGKIIVQWLENLLGSFYSSRIWLHCNSSIYLKKWISGAQEIVLGLRHLACHWPWFNPQHIPSSTGSIKHHSLCPGKSQHCNAPICMEPCTLDLSCLCNWLKNHEDPPPPPTSWIQLGGLFNPVPPIKTITTDTKHKQRLI